MPETLSSLRQLPKMHDLPIGSIQLVKALRLTAVARQNGDDPMQFLPVTLGSITAAKAFVSVARAMGGAWPEPFMLFRPCCGNISYDEALAAHMLIAACSGDRRAFTLQCRDLLAEAHHDMLFDSMVQLAGALAMIATSRS